jgi:serine/threonine protein kinase
MAGTDTDTSVPDMPRGSVARARTGPIDELLPRGTIIDDRYCIDQLLGEGGMGAVYSAEHVKVGRRVAFKVLSAQWCESDNVVRRFRDEARAASAAGHPNIVEVFDAGDLPDGRPYIVMEHLEGRELAEVIDRNGGLEVERACRILRDVARALDAAHARGVIHRDLKGENVMLVERAGEEVVKVLDFGIAANTALAGPRTVAGVVMGTPATMAPEQVKGRPPTIAIDVYSLGVLLHFALSGRLPFDDREGVAVLLAKTSEPAPSIATLCDGLPAALVELVDSCLAIEPEMRPATAREVADRLGEVLEELRGSSERAPKPVLVGSTAVVARRSSSAEAAPPRRRLVVAAVTLATLAAFGGVGWLVMSNGSQPLASVSPSEPSPPPAPTLTRNAEPPSDVPGLEPERTTTADPPPTEPTPTTTGDAPTKPVRATADVSTKPPMDSSSAADLPSVEPEDDPPAASTASCSRKRKQAQQSREVYEWEGVLRHTSNASCWAEQREERQWLRAKAFSELGRWDECLKASRGLASPEGRKLQDRCRLRKEQG